MIQIEIAELNGLGLGFCNYMCSLGKYQDNQCSPEFMLFPMSNKVIDYDTEQDRQKARDELLQIFTTFNKESQGSYSSYGLVFYFDYDEEIKHLFDLFEQKSAFLFDNPLFYVPFVQLHMPKDTTREVPHFHAVIIPKTLKPIREPELTTNILKNIDFPADKGKYEYRVHVNNAH